MSKKNGNFYSVSKKMSRFKTTLFQGSLLIFSNYLNRSLPIIKYNYQSG